MTKKVVQVQRKIGNLDIYRFTTAGQSPSTEEDDVIRSKAPEGRLNGPCGRTVLPTAVSEVRDFEARLQEADADRDEKSLRRKERLEI